MATNSVTMKRHDTRPFLEVILQDVNVSALDLSATVSGITFTMKNLDDDAVKVKAQDCSLVNTGSDGMVRYS